MTPHTTTSDQQEHQSTTTRTQGTASRVYHSLTAFQRDTLIVLPGLEAPSGKDVRSELEDYYAEDINTSRLYQALNRLVEMGLVKKTVGWRANSYTLTHRGAEVLAAGVGFRRDMVGGGLDVE